VRHTHQALHRPTQPISATATSFCCH
jgi:hypothetical protein